MTQGNMSYVFVHLLYLPRFKNQMIFPIVLWSVHFPFNSNNIFLHLWKTKSSFSPCCLAVDRQEEIIPEHPNNSNIRCSPQDKRCIQRILARHPPKSTNQRSNTAREDTKPVLVRGRIIWWLISFTKNNKPRQSALQHMPQPQLVFRIKVLQVQSHEPNSQVVIV